MKNLIINQNDSMRIKSLVADNKAKRKFQNQEIFNLIREIERGECLPPEKIPPRWSP